MRQFDKQDSKTVIETVRSSLMLLSFGLGILAFLIAIDRPEWFNLRPVSGAAAAMSNAADSSPQAKEEQL
ncbi:hypothetical protein PX699_06215 [Sphingobium sp. H39-3-25]|uniref:hypothetical protein n=1 Tax=Sphingobium arseniciresistens TaxID=3030834 RepID=UPI0023B99E3D|nr:hypothetical protein [Sphingobium arseniciresistens]